MTAPVILVVEDDRDVREALADALADAGLHAELAEDGQIGLDRLDAGCRPAVVLLDLRMPRVSGEHFLRAVRADPRFEHLPVITMTAGTEAVADDGVVAQLRKPFDLDQLLEVVVSLCQPVRA